MKNLGGCKCEIFVNLPVYKLYVINNKCFLGHSIKRVLNPSKQKTSTYIYDASLLQIFNALHQQIMLKIFHSLISKSHFSLGFFILLGIGPRKVIFSYLFGKACMMKFI